MNDRATQPSSTFANPQAGQPHGFASSSWMVGSAYDLAFIANIAWPLLLLPGLSNRSETVVDFWQVYFLTLPHRWITLVLVATDPDRRGGKGMLLGGIALLAVLIVLTIWMGTGALTCLAVVDYAWNAWHFAAQHSGILRIYSRKAGLPWTWIERYGLRIFILYVILRTATWTTGWLDGSPIGRQCLDRIDLAIYALPLWLLLTSQRTAQRSLAPRTIYLVSICTLYGGLLASISWNWSVGVICLTTASGMVHAVEYLAVVSHYAVRRRSVGSEGLFRSVARVWLSFLAVYVVVLGSMGVWLESPSSGLFEVWQALNLWAALVHYAFDGLIWKLRQPETARALNASVTGA